MPLETYATILIGIFFVCAFIALVSGKIGAAICLVIGGVISIVAINVVVNLGFASEMEKAFPYIFGFFVLLIGLRILRGLLAFFVGDSAADTAVGTLLASVIKFLFLSLVWPIKVLRRLFYRL